VYTVPLTPCVALRAMLMSWPVVVTPSTTVVSREFEA